MSLKKPTVEQYHTNDLNNRDDARWSHPELVNLWGAGNADAVNMCLDPKADVEKRRKRLKKLTDQSAQLMAQFGYDPFKGTDFMEEGQGFGHLEEFECPGSPEDPNQTHHVYAVIPDKKKKHRPVIFFIMGGCFFMQDPRLYPQLLRWGKKFDAVVVSPKYSTLLDGSYPLQINECHAAYQWMIDNADMLGVDADRCVVFGLSTGAQLAASLAFRLKRYGITPRGCVLCDPMIDDRGSYPSSRLVKSSSDARLAHAMYTAYVGAENVGLDYLGPEAFANHATVDECRGLCPMFVNAGESDQDRDPAIEFASKCLQANVFTTLHIWGGAGHATLFNSSEGSLSERFYAEVFGAISDCLTYDLRRPWTVEQ
ncbi:MAG: alpha/beta hydrolase [Tractidigestivibacter sp.]|jgi:acetyl esterase/lipase|uniref:alpha/beta hydrolase n=1 Tax=Tractidigestivibacter sp. TaxID=2847320 RepID=UPI003D902BED